jgi:hypothetical protein
MKPITEHKTLNDSLHDYVLSGSSVIIFAGEIAAGGVTVHPPCSATCRALACAHVPGAGSTVPSDGVVGHVSPETPSFGPCFHFPDDPGDLADVVGCSVGAVLRVQMASQPLMLLLASILLAGSDVLGVSIGDFSTLDSPLLGGWWNNRNQEEMWVAMD